MWLKTSVAPVTRIYRIFDLKSEVTAHPKKTCHNRIWHILRLSKKNECDNIPKKTERIQNPPSHCSENSRQQVFTLYAEASQRRCLRRSGSRRGGLRDLYWAPATPWRRKILRCVNPSFRWHIWGLVGRASWCRAVVGLLGCFCTNIVTFHGTLPSYI